MSEVFAPRENPFDSDVELSLVSGTSGYLASALYSFSTIAFDVMAVTRIFSLVLSVLSIDFNASDSSSDSLPLTVGN